MTDLRRFALAAAAALAGLAAIASPARAAGGPVDFTLEGKAGLLEGRAWERVFAYPLGERFTASELTWDLGNVALVGLRASATVVGRVEASLDWRVAVSKGDGRMTDSDWTLFPAGPDGWTDRSIHPDTTLDRGSALDASLAVRMLPPGSVSLEGILGWKHEAWRWSSRGGTFVYSTYDAAGNLVAFRNETGSFPAATEVIRYEQRYSVPYAGLGVGAGAGALRLRGRVLFSPFVTASDRDYHDLRALLFEGDFTGGTYVAADAEATWSFTPRLFATCTVSYERFAQIVGDVVVSGALPGGPVRSERYSEAGGVELESAVVSVGFGARF